MDAAVRVRMYVCSRTFKPKNGLFANEEESMYVWAEIPFALTKPPVAVGLSKGRLARPLWFDWLTTNGEDTMQQAQRLGRLRHYERQV
jgi:hypothetical protein